MRILPSEVQYIARGRYLKRYCVMAITLCYVIQHKKEQLDSFL
jgi:hypothetical protein